MGALMTAPRIRKLSIVRNYQSPADFVIDRFRSNVLRYVIVVLMLIPSWIFVYS